MLKRSPSYPPNPGALMRPSLKTQYLRAKLTEPFTRLVMCDIVRICRLRTIIRILPIRLSGYRTRVCGCWW